MSGQHQIPEEEHIHIFILYLFAARGMRPLVPQPLELVEVFPGMTCGGFYLARHCHRGVEVAKEFGLVPGVCQHGEKKGFYLRSFRPGSGDPYGEAFGVTDLVWETRRTSLQVRVLGGDQTLLTLEMPSRALQIPIRIGFPFLRLRGGGGAVFLEMMQAPQVSFMISTVRAARPPFADLPFRVKLASIRWQSAEVLSLEGEQRLPGKLFKEAHSTYGRSRLPDGQGSHL